MGRKSRWDFIANEKMASSIDWEEVASECIIAYFSNKQWHCGGPVPESDLLSEVNIQTVLRTRFDKRWEKIVHDRCLPCVPVELNIDIGNLAWEVYCLIEILNEMGTLWIPKDFQPGLILLYFKFCKDVEIPGPPLL